MSSTYQKEVIWTPHPKQKEALKRLEFEILYGGARGGGKTDAGINWLIYDVDNPSLRALIIRRNSDDLRDWVDRANQIYSKLGAIRAGNPPEFRWPSGAVFRTGHLKDDQAYTKYIGHEYHRMLIEELTQIPSENNYLRLLSSCRSTNKELKPQVFATTNPGETGHGWVKARFIDPVPPGTPNKEMDRIFIQSTIDDNPSLMEADPNYVSRILDPLKEKDPDRYRAWRFGSWDIFAGQVFREFRRDKHVVKRLLPKKKFPHFLWFDWGYSGRESDEGAFAGLAGSLVSSKHNGLAFNRVVVYKEWYGKYLNPEEWAEKIYKEKPVKFYRYGVADAAMFNTQTDGSISIADLMQNKWKKLNKGNWVTLRRGTRNRIARVATLHNWLSIAPDGMPYLIITENCNHLIRTIPGLVHDEHNIEDVDTDSEDHLYDCLTYGLSMVKFIPAHLGGVGPKQKMKEATKPPLDKLDLKAFETSPRKSRDWRML